MKPLVLTDEVRSDVARLIQHAKANPLSLAAMRSIMAKTRTPIGDDSDFAITIPLVYRCVYSHEMQPVMGRCRHLSISSLDGKLGIAVVDEIAKLFGFKEGINSADHAWKEEIGDGRIAVNLLQRVLPDDKT
jgi:hypothetical protein